MATAITGFGAEQLKLTPQTFQALALGGSPPVPPAQPYGTPNQNLVPVQRANPPGVPANLTIAAAPVFHALLQLNQTVIGASSPATGSPPNSTADVDAQNKTVLHQVLGGANINSTVTTPNGPVSFNLTQAPAYVTSGYSALQQTLALTPTVSVPKAAQTLAQQATGANDPPPQTTQPGQQTQGPGSGSSGGGQPSSTSGQGQAPQPAPQITSAPSIPPSSQPQYVEPSNPGLVANIVSTVVQLAASAIYPAPVFSFSR